MRICCPWKRCGTCATPVLIPEGSEFITPIEWYYTKLPVRTINLNGAIVYSFALPLISISKKRLTAKQFISYPTPNIRQNVTLKLKVPDSKWYISQAAEAIELSPHCFVKIVVLSTDSRRQVYFYSAVFDSCYVFKY